MRRGLAVLALREVRGGAAGRGGTHGPDPAPPLAAGEDDGGGCPLHRLPTVPRQARGLPAGRARGCLGASGGFTGRSPGSLSAVQGRSWVHQVGSKFGGDVEAGGGGQSVRPWERPSGSVPVSRGMLLEVINIHSLRRDKQKH